MKPEGSLPCSQQPATSPYPEQTCPKHNYKAVPRCVFLEVGTELLNIILIKFVLQRDKQNPLKAFAQNVAEISRHW
jgi:hypothetical protein